MQFDDDDDVEPYFDLLSIIKGSSSMMMKMDLSLTFRVKLEAIRRGSCMCVCRFFSIFIKEESALLVVKSLIDFIILLEQ